MGSFPARRNANVYTFHINTNITPYIQRLKMNNMWISLNSWPWQLSKRNKI